MAEEPTTSSSREEAKTTTGDTIVLDTSVEATSPFGFNAGQVVRFMKSRNNGRLAKVRGVASGSLWFSVPPENEEVQTTSCTCAAEYVRQYGWMVVEPDTK